MRQKRINRYHKRNAKSQHPFLTTTPTPPPFSRTTLSRLHQKSESKQISADLREHPQIPHPQEE
jgi:hypothetical protein